MIYNNIKCTKLQIKYIVLWLLGQIKKLIVSLTFSLSMMNTNGPLRVAFWADKSYSKPSCQPN